MIIFLYGEDSFRARQKIQELKEKFTRELNPAGDSLIMVDGSKSDLAEISAAFNTGSLFSTKRLVIISNLFLNKQAKFPEKALELFQKQNLEKNDNIFIFWEPNLKNVKGKIVKALANKDAALLVSDKKLFDFLNTQKFCQEFKTLSPMELMTWIKKEVENKKSNIKPQAIRLLVSLCGSDLWAINNEINKLINYKKVGSLPGEITEDDVKQLVVEPFLENIFSLTDALGQNNKVLANKILEEQYLAGLESDYLLAVFLRHFKNLLQIQEKLRSGTPVAKMAVILRLHPFVVKKGIEQAKNFSTATLKNIIGKLTEMDSNYKSGRGEQKSAFNLLILQN